MNIDTNAAARFARWWSEALTHTAPSEVGSDRREEVASDVHDQLALASAQGVLAAGSRAVVSRVLRGVPADIAWRVGLEATPSRFAWHLRNPSTMITTLMVVMVPLNFAADSARGRYQRLVDYRLPLWILTDAMGAGILVLAVLALGVRVLRRMPAGVERVASRSRLERMRRGNTAALGVALAGAAVFRFAPVSAVGAAFWGAFGICLVLYLTLLVATAGSKVLTLGRYLPKVTA